MHACTLTLTLQFVYTTNHNAAHFKCKGLIAANHGPHSCIFSLALMCLFARLFCRSQAICQFLYRFPIFVDATAAAAQRRGNNFLALYADIMTGRIPKANIFRPDISLPIAFEVLVLLWKMMFTGGGNSKMKSQ